MGLQERLRELISAKGLKPSKFEELCGLSNGMVSKIGDNTRATTLNKTSKALPDVNLAWLKTGEGPMLISPAVPPEPSVSAAPKLQPDALSLDVLVRKIAEQAEEIGRLKAENAALKTLHKE